jgi:cyclin-dependent kinase
MGGRLSSQMAKSILKQIIAGTEYCHANGVMHRDMKPQNILIDKTGSIKLIDFGLARAFTMPLKPYTHEVVTLWYRAPEVLLGDKLYSPSIDIWSIGAIFAEVAEGGRAIFNGDSEIDQIFKTFKVTGTPCQTLWKEALDLPDFKKSFPKW